MKTLSKNRLTAHHSCDNPAEHAADTLQQHLSTNKPTLFLSSGGSSLQVLTYLSGGISWEDITVTVLDERVTDKRKDRNFHQLKDCEVMNKKRANIRFINPLSNPEVAAETAGNRFAAKLEQWLADNPDGRVVATVGIGADGHIAGMIPVVQDVFAERFQTDSIIAIGYSDASLDNEFKHRITTTEAFFTDYLDQAVAYAVGSKKCSILQQLVAESVGVYDRPVELLKQTETELFTDCYLDVNT